MAIAKAANSVGIRMAFALSVRDQNPVIYGPSEEVLSGLHADERRIIEQYFLRPALSPQEYIRLTREIASAIEGPLVNVQLGPAGVQWCSRSMLEAIAEESRVSGRRVHMHLLETPYQRTWADAEYPGGVVKFLDEIGLLSERLSLAHCTHATPDELDLISSAGAQIVTNLSSNLHLQSGVAPIGLAHRCGCKIAVGIDGLAFDEDDDAIRELRLVYQVHGGAGFERNWTSDEFFDNAIRAGRRVVGAPGTGHLSPGQPADFVALDLDKLDRDQIAETDPFSLFFARANAGFVDEVVVNGRSIVRSGAVTGIDLPAAEQELRSMYRAKLPQYKSLEKAFVPFERAMESWYRRFGCS